jgi:primosomal replication protein N''
MIRFCIKCGTERPLSEMFCEGVVDSRPCGWDLSTLPIREPGWRPGPTPPALEPIPARRCPNGHDVAEGDIMCLVCGADLEAVGPGGFDEAPQEPYQPAPPTEATVVNGWRLVRPLPASSAVRERFIAVHNENNRQAVLTLYCDGAEPDPAVFDVLRTLPRDHVPEIIETGRWQDRAYEVAEEVTGGTLADIGLIAGDLAMVRRIVEEIGRALNAFSQVGLRHRDLRPGTILVRQHEPLDLVVTGFGSRALRLVA